MLAATQITKADCPHCLTKSVQFVGGSNREVMWENRRLDPIGRFCDGLFQCGFCGRGVIFVFKEQRGPRSVKAVQTRVMYPAHVSQKVPQHTPDPAVSFFDQGVSSWENKNYDAAGVMLRKSLEAGLKVTLQNATGSLYDCIVQAGASNKLTPDMVEWAQTMRVMGNSAAHDMTPWTEGEAKELLEFVNLLFTYLFTLPRQTKEARKKAEARRRPSKT